ncbi:hypothetical protein EDB81DRAFT_874278 [Dactylonectria macrodidyma]|uniref:Uncharacterized protein n=1 Tax=Dactylonectria macrodidyma TaxID=307937 RepID=A0A9P9FS31_9HYPO|nr:hypothetical protein EDB81DRAFT_874278 [Dactylonectria macrodidyma]
MPAFPHVNSILLLATLIRHQQHHQLRGREGSHGDQSTAHNAAAAWCLPAVAALLDNYKVHCTAVLVYESRDIIALQHRRLHAIVHSSSSPLAWTDNWLILVVHLQIDCDRVLSSSTSCCSDSRR